MLLKSAEMAVFLEKYIYLSGSIHFSNKKSQFLLVNWNFSEKIITFVNTNMADWLAIWAKNCIFLMKIRFASE